MLRAMDAERLKTIKIFADLDDEARVAISKLAAEVSVPEGKELVREGDYSYDLIAIEEGTADHELAEVVYDEHPPGPLEICAVFSDRPLRVRDLGARAHSISTTGLDACQCRYTCWSQVMSSACRYALGCVTRIILPVLVCTR